MAPPIRRLARWPALLALVISADSWPAASAAVPVQGPPRVLRGRVELDEDGVRRTPTIGSFELWIQNSGSEHRDVVLTNGAFELEVPEHFAWIDIGPMHLEGREAFCASGFQDSAPREPQTLVARWTKPCTLRVVNGQTGRDLEGVEVVVCDNHFYPTRDGISRSLGDDLKSPVMLPLWLTENELGHGFVGTRTYWARGSGFAWKSISVDATNGGERVLELEPDAVLLIEIEGGKLPDGSRLFVGRGERDDPRDMNLEYVHGKDCVLESLVPGRYRVRIEIVDEHAMPVGRLLALETIELQAGKIGNVLLKPRDPAQPLDTAGNAVQPRAKLAGRVRIPAAWNTKIEGIELERYELSARGYRHRDQIGTDRLVADPSDPELFRFDLGLVEAGAWLAVVASIPWSQTFVVDPTSGADVTIAIPPPVDVRVKVVDADTRADLEAEVGWYSMPPPQPSGIHLQPISRDSEHKEFVFRATLGEIVVATNLRGYGLKWTPLTVHAGQNEVTIEMPSLIEIRVEVFDGEARLPVNGFWVQAEEVGGSGKQQSTEVSDVHKVWVDAPGLYRLTLSAIEGFATTPPIEIDVKRGAVAQAVFRVQRARR